MNDYLISGLTANKTIRVFAVDATQTVREAQKIHDTWPASTAALGRTMIGTLLISAAGLKDEDQKLTVRIQGDGPVGTIIADGSSHGTVRGYIQNPEVNLPSTPAGKIDVGRAVGHNGLLSVTKDIGVGEPFTGKTPLVTGELGDDFTYYLAQSEQIPSAIGLSVFVNPDGSVQVAGGFLVQVLPGASDETIQKLEKRIRDLPLVSELLQDGLSPQQILKKIFPDDEIEWINNEPVAYECDCSKDRFAKALATLPTSELKAMIDEDHGAEAVCKFCGKRYHYDDHDLEEIIATKDAK